MLAAGPSGWGLSLLEGKSLLQCRDAWSAELHLADTLSLTLAPQHSGNIMTGSRSRARAIRSAMRVQSQDRVRQYCSLTEDTILNAGIKIAARKMQDTGLMVQGSTPAPCLAPAAGPCC